MLCQPTYPSCISLEIRKTLHPQDNEYFQNHIKEMTEIFDGFSVIYDPIMEED